MIKISTVIVAPKKKERKKYKEKWFSVPEAAPKMKTTDAVLYHAASRGDLILEERNKRLHIEQREINWVNTIPRRGKSILWKEDPKRPY